MKRNHAVAFVCLLVMLSAQCYGQTKKPGPARSPLANTAMHYFPGVPTGVCDVTDLATNGATGDLYDCLTGSWHLSSSSLPATLTAPGVFTDTQMNENFAVIIGSGCTPSSIFSAMQAGNFGTDAISGTVCVPSSTTNAFSSGVAGYAASFAPSSSCGPFPPSSCAAMGVSGNALAVATGSIVWGGQFIAQSTSGHVAILQGAEIDVDPANSGDTGSGLILNISNPSSGNVNIPAINIHGNSVSNFWSAGIQFASGSINSASGVAPAIILNPATSGNSAPSQAIIFNPTNSSGAIVPSHLVGFVDGNGNSELTTINHPLGLQLAFYRTNIFSVAGTPLPACNAAETGTEVQVSDATAPTFLGAYVGSGAIFSPVVCNGTNWVTY